MATAASEFTWACDRILVATDGSGPSVAALGWAARIAEEIPADLTVVYAYDVDAEGASPEEAGAAAQARLDRWCAEHGALLDLRSEAQPGDPRAVLRDAIGRVGPDLVVVGSRGGGGFPGLLLGSVAEWLSQVATFPLAVVPAAGQRRSGGSILVGVDGSPQSQQALEWAIGLAGRLRRTVQALHAVPSDGPGAEPGPVEFASLEPVRREIDGARPHAAAVHVGLQLAVSGEHPVTALVDRAHRDDAEAIVVGARGYGPFGELTIGRVPRQLLRAANRPVVVIPTG